MLNELCSTSGLPVKLGKKLTSGGEGAIYELQGVESLYVAKIYHKDIPEKKEKIILMADCGHIELYKICAWPLFALFDAQRHFKGFVMYKVNNYEPIHKLYTPQDRKEIFPDVNWHFLIHCARNLAAAFHTVHSQNFVIGDVNQRNIYVSKNAMVKLIDCDSFQVSIDHKTYHCGVGVPDFTPPEILIKKSYEHVYRNQNHDNFGLAVLIFHLLFMGRHPFAGVHSDPQEVSLQKAIQNFQYAYSRYAKEKGIQPPKHGLPISNISDALADLFERAFSPSGASDKTRPTAEDWIRELDNFQKSLKICNNQKNHIFYNALTYCPWCEFKKKTHIELF